MSFDCRESGEKWQKSATGHKNFAIFFTLMRLFSCSIQAILNVKTCIKRRHSYIVNSISGVFVYTLLVENQAKKCKKLHPEDEDMPDGRNFLGELVIPEAAEQKPAGTLEAGLPFAFKTIQCL